MRLSDVFRNVEKNGNIDKIKENYEITSITSDLSRVKDGSLFAAINGKHFDGHRLIEKAVEKGAVCILSEKNNVSVPENTALAIVGNTRKAFALVCANFSGNPSAKLRLTGITGTNGKTTTACMLRHILSENGLQSGVIGTVEAFSTNKNGVRVSEKTGYTTPSPEILHPLLSKLYENGCSDVILEVSSQALDQSRVHGLRFALGVFTNLSVDHLDYHGDLETYRDAKLKLFSVSDLRLANCDCDYSLPFVRFPGGTATYSTCQPADFVAENISVEADGSSYDFIHSSGRYRVNQTATGFFNIYNSLSAVSSAVLLGVHPCSATEAMATFREVTGRMERVQIDAPFRVYIDFAHTPDGLQCLLAAVRSFTDGRIILVFGCGGDRDRSKRPIMGKIAVENADYSVITSDNPRSEEPEKIIEDVLSGTGNMRNYTVEPDRRMAIKTALSLAKNGDTVILAGKGHETYQEINGVRLPFDEREVVKEYF